MTIQQSLRSNLHLIYFHCQFNYTTHTLRFSFCQTLETNTYQKQARPANEHTVFFFVTVTFLTYLSCAIYFTVSIHSQSAPSVDFNPLWSFENTARSSASGTDCPSTLCLCLRYSFGVRHRRWVVHWWRCRTTPRWAPVKYRCGRGSTPSCSRWAAPGGGTCGSQVRKWHTGDNYKWLAIASAPRWAPVRCHYGKWSIRSSARRAATIAARRCVFDILKRIINV